ncbi:hypothetical protein F4861DRAFT_536003 [Xylaria intraflava]|nr:hypothetical protein F4861DRAFT_536003 [Xylaria intraflava]
MSSRPDWNRRGCTELRLPRPPGDDPNCRPGADERRNRADIFPSPPIRARPRRPQSVHILSYPSGYVPNEVRADLAKCKRAAKAKKKNNRSTELAHKATPERAAASPSWRAFEKVLASFKPSTGNSHPVDTNVVALASAQSPIEPTPLSPVFPVFQNFPIPPSGETSSSSSSSGMLSVPLPGVPPMPSTAMAESQRASAMSTALHNTHWNGVMAGRSAKHMVNSVTEITKPVASGNGVQCSIILAEPNVFLTGFEHDGRPQHENINSTALLRGKLQLSVTKNVKLRSVTLKLHGKARTEWPEGIPPTRLEQHEEVSLRTQALTFFHAMHETWETEFGNQCCYSLRSGNTPSKYSPPHTHVPTISSALGRGPTSNPSVRDQRRLSLQPAHSFGKDDLESTEVVPPRTHKTFYPGQYEYSFELPIDHHQLETTRLQFASVKWELEAVVERTGKFKPNLHGTKEVRIVRVPDQLSLEMTEPIFISKQWEDQLHYDIMISGKSFPLGTHIPIAFKLTPLAKVQVHKLKVFVTESVEYWTSDRKVTRKDPGRKVLLFEKSAGKPLDKRYESSGIRIISGGELSPDERYEARAAAERRRGLDATMNHTSPVPLPEPSENMLGDLDLGLESYWGPTEMEMNVQLPTCEQMAKDKNMRLHPDCSWKNVNVHHWIKVVMRISRLDPDDPAGKRRRHFEISIDSPFTVLDCRATQSNTALPEYSIPQTPTYSRQTLCGCPDANVLATCPSPTSNVPPPSPAYSTLDIPASPPYSASAIPASPPYSASAIPASPPYSLQPPVITLSVPTLIVPQPRSQRPMHLLRQPSHNPPAFDADIAPPAIPTPPPQYELVVGTPSVDGLADYFARLADYDGDSDSADEDEDEDASVRGRLTERSGRVNVPHPRTPGGRLVSSRSLEFQRPGLALPAPPPELRLAGALQQRRG